MNVIGKFHRVVGSKETPLPKRATKGSAGYDFYCINSEPVVLKPNESVTLETNVCAEIEEGWVLMIFPRSGLGFKYQVGLANTVGVIDSDYYHADNGGHIMVKLVNRGTKELVINPNDKFCQGVFLPYGIVEDDDEDSLSTRTGGFGSTD